MRARGWLGAALVILLLVAVALVAAAIAAAPLAQRHGRAAPRGPPRRGRGRGRPLLSPRRLPEAEAWAAQDSKPIICKPSPDGRTLVGLQLRQG
jgi:hypothetical protein